MARGMSPTAMKLSAGLSILLTSFLLRRVESFMLDILVTKNCNFQNLERNIYNNHRPFLKAYATVVTVKNP